MYRVLRELKRAGSHASGGNGSAALPGTEPDHPASQDSLVYDAAQRALRPTTQTWPHPNVQPKASVRMARLACSAMLGHGANAVDARLGKS